MYLFLSLLSCYHIAVTKAANAGAQKPKPLPDGGQQAVIWQQTVMREEYAEMTDSGFGLLQHIVSKGATVTIYFMRGYPFMFTASLHVCSHTDSLHETAQSVKPILACLRRYGKTAITHALKHHEKVSSTTL